MNWSWRRSQGPAINLPDLLRTSAAVVGLCIPLALAAGLYNQRIQLLTDAEQRAANTAVALEHHAARTIEVTDAYLQAVASLVGIQARERRSQALHTSLREQLARSRGLINIIVIDRDGTPIAEANNYPARIIELRERDYFKILRDQSGKGLAIGKPLISTLSGRLVLPIARRIEDPDGKFVGVVVAALDAETFQTFYDEIDDGPGALLHLWRLDGTLLVRSPSKPEFIGQSYAASENYQRYVVKRITKPFWSVDTTDGRERVIAFGFLKDYPLYVRASLAKTEILAPWHRSIITQCIFGAVVTLVIIAALVLLAREIEQRRETDRLIRASERRFRLLAENSNDIIVLIDLSMRRAYVSPAVISILGYEADQFIGYDLYELVHSDDVSIVARIWEDMQSERCEQVVSRIRYRHKAGHYVWIEISVRLARDEQDGQPVGYVAAMRDVTERHEAEEQVRHMAMHDALTGLPNRILIHEQLNQAVAQTAFTRRPFALLLCDLDRFKAVNDSYGHPVGDALLRVVASRMKDVLRPRDTIARLGGDEFAILLCHLDEPGSAQSVAEQVIAAASAPIELDAHVIEVGISVGLSIAGEMTVGADELFKRADIALYEAKAAGRNTYREFCPNTSNRIALRSQLGLDMKEAIRHGEFQLVYQPIIDAATRKVVSFEALMRWQHPSRGQVSPGEFIPVAEETGFIVPLGAWALQEACREAAGWAASIRVAVNVSAVQLRRPAFEAMVVSALAVSGLPADRLKLEVTESVLMQDADEVLGRLRRLRALGVRIALDDFGTGYSSLSYLRRFPFDQIKIDRAFIRDIADPDAAAIVRAVADLGKRLGMGIVAEGVETAEQFDLVRQEGCTQVQGFLFSRPLPAHQARQFIDVAQAKAA